MMARWLRRKKVLEGEKAFRGGTSTVLVQRFVWMDEGYHGMTTATAILLMMMTMMLLTIIIRKSVKLRLDE